jgi:hypothetical protein
VIRGSSFFRSVLLSTLAAACGASHDTPPATGDVVPHVDGGNTVKDAAAEVSMVDAPGDAPESGGDARSTSFGDLVILDVPDTACVPSRADAVLASEGLATAGGFEKLGQMGDRRFAFGTEGSVALTFGYDGASPSAPILGPLAATAQNDALVAVVANGSGLAVRYYDAMSAPAGGDVALEGSMIAGPSIGAGPTKALAVWCTPTDVNGRLIDQSRVVGEMVSLEGGAGDGECRTATLWNGMSFTVVWTRLLHDGKTKTSIAFIDLDGTLSFGKVLILSDGSHELVDFAQAPFGYVVLLDEGERTGNPVAIRLDPFGNIKAPAVRLQGSRQSFSVATYQSDFAVGALLGDGRAAMRVFDASANVQGPWVCVDDRPPDMPFAGRVALGTDDRGYGVLARMSDASNWYMRTNRRGDGPPESD